MTCHHPNEPNTVLILPEIGVANGTLLNRAILHFISSDMRVHLVRIQHDHMGALIEDSLGRQERRYHDYAFQIEKRLDWAYPVRIFDCARIISQEGKDYERLRRRYNHFTSRFNIECIPLKEFQQKHKSEWTSALMKSAAIKFKIQSMDSDYYYTLFELMSIYPDLYDGLIFYDKNHCVGLSVWEIPIAEEAISLINISDLSYKYLSVFQVVQSCIKAKGNGINYLNFGGSETEGLDRFKRSIFKPVRSLTLLSARVLYDTQRGALQTQNIVSSASITSALEKIS